MTDSIRKNMIKLKKTDVRELIPFMEQNRSKLLSLKDFPTIWSDWKYYFKHIPYSSKMKDNELLENDILVALKVAVLANKNSEAVKLINEINDKCFNQDFLDQLTFIKGLLLIKKGVISDEAKFNLSTHLKYIPRESLGNLVHYFIQYILHSKSKNATFKRAKRLLALYSKSTNGTANDIHCFVNVLDEILFGDSTRFSDAYIAKLIYSQEECFSINSLDRNVLIAFAYLCSGREMMASSYFIEATILSKTKDYILGIHLSDFFIAIYSPALCKTLKGFLH